MNSILTIIKPSPEEQKRVSLVTRTFLEKLNKKLKNATALLGGSGAKGTWLSGNHDLDIFVLYPKQTYASRSEELSNFMEKSLKLAFPKQELRRVHGSRDYFQMSFDGYSLEVVPILKITKPEQAVNITDISPLHTKWVKRQPAKIKDEILLAKQFCKAHGFYGAESYIGGFSGYILEILVSYYGSFEKLLRASQRWKKRDVIDIEKHYPKKDACFQLNQSKIISPLIVIDPVDKNRNAAAALSEEKWDLFRKKAADYLKNPASSFFEPKKVTLDSWRKEIQELGRHGVWLDLSLPEGKEDVIGVKMIKALKFICQELSHFGVLSSGLVWDKRLSASLHVEVRSKLRPAEEIKIGPPLHLSEFVADFKKKNKNAYVENDRIKAKIKISQVTIEENIKVILRKSYFTEKIMRVKRITLI